MGLATNILLRGFSVRKLLWWLIAGSPGGPNRARILMEIHNRPSNAHQLSERLNLNYKTVRHHLKILEDNGMIVSAGKKSGVKLFFLSDEMIKNYDIFDRINSEQNE
jgi:DNA-binding transcriptional ArsR family regulator